MDEDDFIDDTTNNHNDFMLEQRSTDRMRDEIKSNGYRDGYQKHFEDEKLMQIGFDIAYARLSEIAFLCGQIKAMAAYSSTFGKDSSFLARLNDKLDKIEQFKFDSLLEFKANSGQEESEQTSLKNLLDDYRQRLLNVRERMGTFTGKIDLEALSIKPEAAEAAEEDADRQVENDLNSLIENLNF